MLLTQKACATLAPPGEFKDMFASQWKQVQNLANTFWRCWKQEYLLNLQTRRKRTDEKQNVQEKDSQVKCNKCPVGLVGKVIPSGDGKIHEVEVKIVKQGTAKIYLRPVSEVNVLLSCEK